LQIEAPEWRAAVARDEARRVQARLAVALFLKKKQPDNGLRAQQIDALSEQIVMIGNAQDAGTGVVELMRHRRTPSGRCREPGRRNIW
jgi:hypothetical protein